MNITTNLRTIPAKNPVVDLYGVSYHNIPSPFDVRNFWQSEVVDVFKKFYNTLHTSLSIAGVFFDFEMYHAPKQTGCYTDLMDFSDCAWHMYAPNTKDVYAQTLHTYRDRIA